ncbi:GNAT family N-acetyltransferase, partial [Vibrio vulnificus]|nr:GNAT family N-acetyltransferase [Vibrio vulnificus]
EKVSQEELRAFARQLSRDAEKGHFEQSHKDYEYNLSFLIRLEETGLIPTAIGLHGFTYSIKQNDELIGFAVVCPATKRQSKCKLELLYFTILEPHRKKGHGKKAIGAILNEFKGHSLSARCMPRSTVMVKMLKKSGFKNEKWAGSLNTNLAHKNS